MEEGSISSDQRTNGRETRVIQTCVCVWGRIKRADVVAVSLERADRLRISAVRTGPPNTQIRVWSVHLRVTAAELCVWMAVMRNWTLRLCIWAAIQRIWTFRLRSWSFQRPV